MRRLVLFFQCGMTVLAAGAALSGCVVAVGGAALGGAGAAVVATDRRSVGIQVEDTEIEHRINSALEKRFARQSVRIDVTSYNQKVLLAGQVPTEQDRSDAEAIAASSQNVRQVVNELTIGSLSGLSSHTADLALAGKVGGALLNASGLPAGSVKISCTDSAIYLFGRVSEKEADIASHAAARVSGVKKVVILFELLPSAEVAQMPHDAQPSAPASPPAETH
ncbi:MAG TPA: BON domain-containing protein [Burkholderiaceae bacterium]|nr:BON domain-containing protein [Burkholderiaceae bacterium]